MTDNDDYEELVTEYVHLTKQRSDIDNAIDSIKAQLRDLGEGQYPIAGLTVRISPNRRLDMAKVTAEYPMAAHPELYVAKPDSALIRAKLAPDVVDSLMASVGPPKVSVS